MTEEKKGIKCNLFLIIGIILLGLGLFADALGIGQDPSFGSRQLLASVLGVAFILWGLKTSKCCQSSKE